MKSDNNKVGCGSALVLEEANELAKSRKWTRSFALYVMFCRAMALGDKIRAEACMAVLEQEVRNSLTGPLF
jgi:hypothetical protein